MSSPPSPPSSAAAAAYTAAEVEVAAILTQLSKKSVDARRRVPELLRWGARRRRTAGPGQPQDELSHVGPSSSSPETPLSFPASGGSSPPPPAFKKGRKYREWVEMQQEKVASLAQGKSSLLQEIEEFKASLQQLQALNSFLKQQKSQLLNRPQDDKAPDGPRWGPAPVTAQVSRRDFDLNEMPMEDDVEEEEATSWGPREEEDRAQRAATSAEARRRRMERQRKKAAAAAQKAAHTAATSEMTMGGAWRVG